MGSQQSMVNSIAETMIGGNASHVQPPPKYDQGKAAIGDSKSDQGKSVIGDSKSGPSHNLYKRDAENPTDIDCNLIHQILEKCNEESFQCLISAATFSHMKALDDARFGSQVDAFEVSLKTETSSCRQAYLDCITSKND